MPTGPTTALKPGPARSPEAALRQNLATAGMDVGSHPALPPPLSSHGDAGCPVLAWAGSGAMALTGWPGSPAWPEGDVVGAVSAGGRLLTEVAGRAGHHLVIDPGRLLCARAAARAPVRRGHRRGTTSFGGACRLMPVGGQWVTLNLGRAEDAALLPALSAGRIDRRAVHDDPENLWAKVADEVASRSADEVVVAAQELGLPASVMGEEAAFEPAPWTIERLGPGREAAVGDRPLVVDFTALWAGPLCAHLLGRAGARVVTVEAVDRGDGARTGDPFLHAALHRGHDRLVADFGTVAGRRRVRDLVSKADVVLEASRPRALAALGLDPAEFTAARPGRTWVSITGYGRIGPRSARVAFGDDAAVAGGLVGRDRRGDPVFCADAVADPVTGVLAAVAALGSMTTGGGYLVDCSMAAAAAFVNLGGRCPGDHRVARDGHGWTAFCDEVGMPVAEPCSGLRNRAAGVVGS